MKNLDRIIGSIAETRAELTFQTTRLEGVEKDTERSESERDHLADLRDGYASAHHYLGILQRYQEGRKRREADHPEDERA